MKILKVIAMVMCSLYVNVLYMIIVKIISSMWSLLALWIGNLLSSIGFRTFLFNIISSFLLIINLYELSIFLFSCFISIFKRIIEVILYYEVVKDLRCFTSFNCGDFVFQGRFKIFFMLIIMKIMIIVYIKIDYYWMIGFIFSY